MTPDETAMDKREPPAVALVLALLTAFLVLPSIRGVDGVGNYVYVLSMIEDGDLDFRNQYALFDLEQDASFRHSDAPISEVTGRPANRYGIGASIFWSPAVVLVHLLLKLFAPEAATGLTRPYEWAVALASAWWAGLGLWLLYFRLREQFDRPTAALALAGVLAATPLAFYMWAHGSMSHAVSFFVAVMAMLTLERVVKDPTAPRALAAGLWAGMLVLTRVQDFTWALAFAIGLASLGRPESHGYTLSVFEERKRWLHMRGACAGLFAAALALTVLPQVAVWKHLYGSWFSGPAPYLAREAGSFAWLPIHFLPVLVSERGGVLAWHPIIALALFGLIHARRALGFQWRLVVFLGLAFQLYLVSCWSMWWAGASFGNRFFISSFPFLAVGLAHGLRAIRARGPRWIAPVLVAGLIAWNCGLLIQYGAGMISREDEVGWALVLKNQFTEVPLWSIRRLGLMD